MSAPPLLLAALLLASCRPSGDSAADAPSGDLVLTDANNYSYTATLGLDAVEIPYGFDPVIDWSGITLDIRGREVADPASASRLTLAAFNMDQQGVLDAIASNDLLQSDIRTYYVFDNSDAVTSAHASDFNIIGNDFVPGDDFVDHGDAVWTWILTLWDENVLGGQDILSSAFVVPSATGTSSTIAFTDDTATLSFVADLHSADPLSTASGLDAYTLDWSGLSEDATGHSFSTNQGDELVIAHLGVGTVGEVEDVFLQALDSADAVYYLDVHGSSAATLDAAVDLEGSTFDGFTTEGVWIVGILCTTCTSPAPLFASTVNVVD